MKYVVALFAGIAGFVWFLFWATSAPSRHQEPRPEAAPNIEATLVVETFLEADWIKAYVVKDKLGGGRYLIARSSGGGLDIQELK